MGIYQRRKKKTDDDSRATELDVKLRHDPSRKSYSVVCWISYQTVLPYIDIGSTWNAIT